jgi:beta-lactamase regulating signal transducer with metallopeptidase domain
MANDFAAITRLLVDTSARAFLLAALAAIVLRFWRPRDANFQHRAWTAVLWGMLLLPILAPLTPALSLLPSGWRWESGPVIAQFVVQSSPAPKKTGLAEPEFLDNAAPIAKTDEPSQAIVPDEAAASSISTQDLVADSGEPEAAATSKTPAFGWAEVISALYLFGVVLLFARLALGYLAVGRLVRRSTDIPRPLGCRARVATSAAVRVPVSVWLLRPVILLPADWHHWSDALLTSVVMHEQAHIDRRDHLVLLVSELNRCLYWFHPVAWFLRRRLSTLAEQCCDDTVIAALQSRGDYARHLLAIASRLTTDPRRALPLGISMARGSQVESRVIAILDERRPLAGRIGRVGMLALAAIVGPIVLLAAGLRAADPPPQKQDAASPQQTVTPTAEPKAKAEPQTQAEATKPPVNGMPVSGRVVLASDGSPAAGAEVQLLLTKPDWHRLDVRRAKTDEQGSFAFEDVPAGTHWLVAVMDGLASRRERSKMTWVTIAAEHSPEPVLLKLSPAPSIAVHVTSKADGAPVPGAEVWLLDNQWDEQTDAQGSVVLRGLTPEV